MSWSTFDTGTGYLTQESALQFFDSKGYVWKYYNEPNIIGPAIGSPWALYETGDCTGTIYVPFAPARLSFMLSGTNQYYVLADNATGTMKTILSIRTGNQCNNQNVQLHVTLLSAAIKVTPPNSFPGVLPIHPEPPK